MLKIKQRFSIRKLTVGVVSVGMAALCYLAPTVSANEGDAQQSTGNTVTDVAKPTETLTEQNTPKQEVQKTTQHILEDTGEVFATENGETLNKGSNVSINVMRDGEVVYANYSKTETVDGVIKHYYKAFKTINVDVEGNELGISWSSQMLGSGTIKIFNGVKYMVVDSTIEGIYVKTTYTKLITKYVTEDGQELLTDVDWTTKEGVFSIGNKEYTIVNTTTDGAVRKHVCKEFVQGEKEITRHVLGPYKVPYLKEVGTTEPKKAIFEHEGSNYYYSRTITQGNETIHIYDWVKTGKGVIKHVIKDTGELLGVDEGVGADRSSGMLFNKIEHNVKHMLMIIQNLLEMVKKVSL